MTADIKALALRLANESGFLLRGARSDPHLECPTLNYEVTAECIALVRAALAEGLRIGAEVCAAQSSYLEHQQHLLAARKCAAALRAKADEMEKR